MTRKANFSLTQIEYVLSVQRRGHFGLAAQECHVTQPTLSMQIHKLEEELGVVIFDRTKKPILLTEKGAKLLAQMRLVLTEALKIDEIHLDDLGSNARGELTVGIIPTLAPYLLPRLLPVVAKNFPDLELKIFELQTESIVRSLGDDTIDVGLLATPLHAANIHERALCLEPFSLLCQKSHKLAKRARVNYAALEANDLWLLQEGHCLRHQVLDICSLKKSRGAPRRGAEPRQFQFESGSLETLKNLVSSYGGYTLLPALSTENLPPHVQLVPFEAPVPAREIGLACSRLQHKKALQDALAACVLEAIPAALRKLRRKDLELVPVA
jgi:LysR family hydrogen peroxide-inducible transcriptional activator